MECKNKYALMKYIELLDKTKSKRKIQNVMSLNEITSRKRKRIKQLKCALNKMEYELAEENAIRLLFLHRQQTLRRT